MKYLHVLNGLLSNLVMRNKDFNNINNNNNNDNIIANLLNLISYVFIDIDFCYKYI